MKPLIDAPLDEKVKSLPIKEQSYINGLIDGALLHRDKPIKPPEVIKQEHKSSA